MLDKAADDENLSPEERIIMLWALYDRKGMGKEAYEKIMKSPDDGRLKRRWKYYRQVAAMINDEILIQERDKYRTTKLPTSPKPIPVKPGTSKPTPKPAPRKP